MAPNYEMPTDADMNNMYQVTLTASDGTNRASRDVTVTVDEHGRPGYGDPDHGRR